MLLVFKLPSFGFRSHLLRQISSHLHNSSFELDYLCSHIVRFSFGVEFKDHSSVIKSSDILLCADVIKSTLNLKLLAVSFNPIQI